MNRKSFLPLSFHFSFIGLLGFIVGVLIQEQNLLPWSLLLPLFFPVGALLTLTLFKASPKITLPLVSFLFCFFSGATLYERHKNAYLNIPSSVFLEKAFIVQENESTGSNHWPHRLKLKCEKHNFSIYLYTKRKPTVVVDDLISCQNLKIKKPLVGGFQSYLVRQRVVATSFLPDAKTVIIHRPRFSLKRWIIQKRKLLSLGLRKKMPPNLFALFSSLFLGESTPNKKLSNHYKPLFKIWGIVHHLARSGLHLALFVFFWYIFLSIIPFPFYFKHCLLVLLCTVYFFFSFPSVSFIRASHMFLIYSICSLLNLPINALHALTLSCLMTLFYNPFHLFFLDFQLSFYLTFCLGWLAHLNRQRKKIS